MVPAFAQVGSAGCPWLFQRHEAADGRFAVPAHAVAVESNRHHRFLVGTFQRFNQFLRPDHFNGPRPVASYWNQPRKNDARRQTHGCSGLANDGVAVHRTGFNFTCAHGSSAPRDFESISRDHPRRHCARDQGSFLRQPDEGNPRVGLGRSHHPHHPSGEDYD